MLERLTGGDRFWSSWSSPGAPPRLDDQRLLVVGGGGFIGRHVVAAARNAGGCVTVLDRKPAPPGVTLNWLSGSVTDLELVKAAAMGCDTVVYLANSSLPGTAHADLAAEVQHHVESTIKVAEVCQSVGVKRFVFASSGGTVYGVDPQRHVGLREIDRTVPRNAYGISKLAIEHYLRLLGAMRGMKTLSLRISNPYGEGQQALRGQGFVAAAFEHAMKQTSMTIWGDGSVERDFVYVGDVARAFVHAATYDGPIWVFNIGSGRGVPLIRLLKRIEKAAGLRVPVEFRPGRPVDVQRNVLDIRRAVKMLGWAPKVGLDEGLVRTATWWKQGRPVGAPTPLHQNRSAGTLSAAGSLLGLHVVQGKG